MIFDEKAGFGSLAKRRGPLVNREIAENGFSIFRRRFDRCHWKSESKPNPDYIG
jgi:hypothetical protein